MNSNDSDTTNTDGIGEQKNIFVFGGRKSGRQGLILERLKAIAPGRKVSFSIYAPCTPPQMEELEIEYESVEELASGARLYKGCRVKNELE